MPTEYHIGILSANFNDSKVSARGDALCIGVFSEGEMKIVV